MSGGESRPPAIRARFGVLGHTKKAGLTFDRINWDPDKHRKRLKMVRNILNGTTRRSKKQPKPVSDTSPTPTRSLIVHPWFTESK